VRELENAIERAVVLTRQHVIDEDALPREIRDAAIGGGAGGASSGPLSFAVGTPLAEIEMRVIHETLRHTRGDKRLAAKLLGIATRTIYRRLEERHPDDPTAGEDASRVADDDGPDEGEGGGEP
jgi:two-component system response regulator HydG